MVSDGSEVQVSNLVSVSMKSIDTLVTVKPKATILGSCRHQTNNRRCQAHRHPLGFLLPLPDLCIIQLRAHRDLYELRMQSAATSSGSVLLGQCTCTSKVCHSSNINMAAASVHRAKSICIATQPQTNSNYVTKLKTADACSSKWKTVPGHHSCLWPVMPTCSPTSQGGSAQFAATCQQQLTA